VVSFPFPLPALTFEILASEAGAFPALSMSPSLANLPRKREGLKPDSGASDVVLTPPLSGYTAEKSGVETNAAAALCAIYHLS